MSEAQQPDRFAYAPVATRLERGPGRQSGAAFTVTDATSREQCARLYFATWPDQMHCVTAIVETQPDPDTLLEGEDLVTAMESARYRQGNYFVNVTDEAMDGLTTELRRLVGSWMDHFKLRRHCFSIRAPENYSRAALPPLDPPTP